MLKDFFRKWLMSDTFFERIKKIEKELERIQTSEEKNQLYIQQETQLREELKELRLMMVKMMEEVKKKQDPIRVEHIENVYIDRYEISNSIGAVGIKELGGRLNIGANYGQGLGKTEKLENKKTKMDIEKKKEEKEKMKNEKQEMSVSYKKKKILIPIQIDSSMNPGPPQINIKRK